jgi:hypothetical protein
LLRKEPPPILEKEDLFEIADQEELSSSEYSDSEENTKGDVSLQKAESGRKSGIEEKKAETQEGEKATTEEK